MVKSFWTLKPHFEFSYSGIAVSSLPHIHTYHDYIGIVSIQLTLSVTFCSLEMNIKSGYVECE